MTNCMRMIVTAGPTREYLDPVRFLSNRSTGKMGYAIAVAAQQRGHDVHLISGPVVIAPPDAVHCTQIGSAQEMHDAVLQHLHQADVLVMCAAVADWRPRQIATSKLKKHEMEATLQLERTADILEAVKLRRRPDQLIVGFAAETDAVLDHARDKLMRKGLDAIVANDVSRADAGFGVDTNAVTLITRAGECETFPLMSKQLVAQKLIAWIEGQISARGHQ